MDIDTMPAGRELDALVIRRVLRWPLFESWQAYYDELWKTGEHIEIGFPVAFWNDQQGYYAVFYAPNHDAKPLRPSTDIAAAWQVVEHLNNRKWPQSALCVIVATHHDGNLAACMIFEGRAASHKAADTFVHLPDYDTAGFFVDTKSRDMSDWFKAAVRVQAETAPLAICRAALKAMEAANG